MSFSVTVIVLNLENIFHFLFKNNIDTHGRGIEATTLSLSSATSGILLVVLVLLVDLALIDGLPTKRVSKGKISKLSFSGVFLLLLSGFVLLKTF